MKLTHLNLDIILISENNYFVLCMLPIMYHKSVIYTFDIVLQDGGWDLSTLVTTTGRSLVHAAAVHGPFSECFIV